MDIPLALEYLTQTGRLQPGEDWGREANSFALYPDFADGWRGMSAVPTLQELDAAWLIVQAAARPRVKRTRADLLTALDSLPPSDRKRLLDAATTYVANSADPAIALAATTADLSAWSQARGFVAALILSDPRWATSRGVNAPGDRPA